MASDIENNKKDTNEGREADKSKDSSNAFMKELMHSTTSDHLSSDTKKSTSSVPSLELVDANGKRVCSSGEAQHGGKGSESVNNNPKTGGVERIPPGERGNKEESHKAGTVGEIAKVGNDSHKGVGDIAKAGIDVHKGILGDIVKAGTDAHKVSNLGDILKGATDAHKSSGLGDILKTLGNGDARKGEGYPGQLEGGDKQTDKKPPMSDKDLDDMSKQIADKLADGRWKFGTPEEKEQFLNQLKDAEERGQLKLLVAKINEELAKQGKDLHLDLKISNAQDKVLPELSPFNSWQKFDISLSADDGTVLDRLDFTGKVTHHPGMYPRY